MTSSSFLTTSSSTNNDNDKLYQLKSQDSFMKNILKPTFMLNSSKKHQNDFNNNSNKGQVYNLNNDFIFRTSILPLANKRDDFSANASYI
jgi:hypothetical protein